jgi:hypothetical protein
MDELDESDYKALTAKLIEVLLHLWVWVLVPGQLFEVLFQALDNVAGAAKISFASLGALDLINAAPSRPTFDHFGQRLHRGLVI